MPDEKGPQFGGLLSTFLMHSRRKECALHEIAAPQTGPLWRKPRTRTTLSLTQVTGPAYKKGLPKTKSGKRRNSLRASSSNRRHGWAYRSRTRRCKEKIALFSSLQLQLYRVFLNG